MTPPMITFFNSRGGLGTTSLVYHLAWMLAELGHRVVRPLRSQTWVKTFTLTGPTRVMIDVGR